MSNSSSMLQKAGLNTKKDLSKLDGDEFYQEVIKRPHFKETLSWADNELSPVLSQMKGKAYVYKLN